MDHISAESQGLWTAKKRNPVRPRSTAAVLFLFLFPGLLALSAPKTDICHYTGNDKKPYVSISVPVGDVQSAHGKHPKDIIPAPKKGCPSAIVGPPHSPPSPDKTPKNTETPIPPKPPSETAIPASSGTPVSGETTESTSTPIIGETPANQPKETKTAANVGPLPNSTLGNPIVNLTATGTPDPSATSIAVPTSQIDPPSQPSPPRGLLAFLYKWCCTQRDRPPLWISILIAALVGVAFCLIVAVYSRLKQHMYS